MKTACNDTLAVSVHRVLNGDLNEHGSVFGGRLLELVDGEASVAAMRVTRTTVVTAAMDHVQFLKPFKLSDSMCMEAYVTGLGHRSVEVFVKVIGEHLNTGKRFLGFTGLMTYVIQDQNKAVLYDELVAANAEQQSLIDGYQRRRAHRLQNRDYEREMLNAITIKKPWEK